MFFFQFQLSPTLEDKLLLFPTGEWKHRKSERPRPCLVGITQQSFGSLSNSLPHSLKSLIILASSRKFNRYMFLES